MMGTQLLIFFLITYTLISSTVDEEQQSRVCTVDIHLQKDDFKRRLMSTGAKLISSDDGIFVMASSTAKLLMDGFNPESNLRDGDPPESCFMISENNEVLGERRSVGNHLDDYKVIPKVVLSDDLTTEDVLDIAESKGGWFFRSYFKLVRNFQNETSRLKYCNKTSKTWTETIVKYLSCGINGLWRKNIRVNYTSNSFFTEDENGNFVPNQDLARRVVEFQDDVNTGKIRPTPDINFGDEVFGFIDRMNNLSDGLVDRAAERLSNIWNISMKIRSKFGLDELDPNEIKVPYAEHVFGVIIEPRLDEINFQYEKHQYVEKMPRYEKIMKFKSTTVSPQINLVDNDFHTQFGVHRGYTYDYHNYDNPNIIAMCRELGSGLKDCTPRHKRVRGFDSDGNPIWTGPGSEDNNEWGTGFVNGLKSLWNFIVFTIKHTIFCIDTDPTECKYCLWTDGFWDSLNNCRYPVFIVEIDYFTDPVELVCDQYTTLPGYMLGLIKFLFWIVFGSMEIILEFIGITFEFSAYLVYPPGLHWCLLWNSFLILFPSAFIIPLVVMCFVNTWCLVSRWTGTVKDMKCNETLGDLKREERLTRKRQNDLISEVDILKSENRKLSLRLGNLVDVSTGLVNTANIFVKKM